LAKNKEKSARGKKERVKRGGRGGTSRLAPKLPTTETLNKQRKEEH